MKGSQTKFFKDRTLFHTVNLSMNLINFGHQCLPHFNSLNHFERLWNSQISLQLHDKENSSTLKGYQQGRIVISRSQFVPSQCYQLNPFQWPILGELIVFIETFFSLKVGRNTLTKCETTSGTILPSKNKFLPVSTYDLPTKTSHYSRVF